jgi:hypothetical protein
MVKLILMIHPSAGFIGRGLEHTIAERFPEIGLEKYENSESFFKRLCQPIHYHEHEICLVLADTRERLEQLMGLEKLFEKRRLFLVLPEKEKEVLSMGHRLQPRYLSCEMNCHGELLSVLEKVIDGLKSSEINENQHEIK